MISAVLSTDLSVSYDTVDKYILLSKLKHYGIKNSELNLIANYLTDRKQNVCIDTFDSEILPSHELQCYTG